MASWEKIASVTRELMRQARADEAAAVAEDPNLILGVTSDREANERRRELTRIAAEDRVRWDRWLAENQK